MFGSFTEPFNCFDAHYLCMPQRKSLQVARVASFAGWIPLMTSINSVKVHNHCKPDYFCVLDITQLVCKPTGLAQADKLEIMVTIFLLTKGRPK